MPFACIFVPDFPVEAVVRNLENTSRDCAVAIYDGVPPQVHVIACNHKARMIGVEAGMTKLQVEACPQVLCKPRSQAQEDSAHAALLDCAHGFSPRVESTAPDTVIADLAGLEHLFGPPQKIAREFARRASDLGMETHVAVAANPDAAMHAARGFPGVTVIPPGEESARLGELAVDVLAPSPEVLETLDRWGVRNLRGLAVLPSPAVTQRLGQTGLHLQRLSRGETMRTLRLVEAPFDFSESMELEDAVDLLEPLAFILGRLLEQLCARLQSRSLATNELRLALQLEVHEDVQVQDGDADSQKISTSHECNLRLPVPMQDSRVFLKLLQLELSARPPAAPVKRVTITAEPVRRRSTQGGLFVPQSPEPERLELTLARIRKVLGDPAGARVGSPEPLDTHHPDTFLMQRFIPPPAQLRSGESGNDAAAETVSALRVFRPPLEAQVELRDGIPASLIFSGQRARVISVAGPWRGSGEWWKSEPWSREEWDVAVALEHKGVYSVALYRIHYDRVSGRWLVEGSYD